MANDIEVVPVGTYPSSKDRILAELTEIRRTDDRLYRILKAMVEDLDHVVLQLNPITGGSTLGIISQDRPPVPVAFGYSFQPISLNLSWTPGDPIGDTFSYEVRVGGSGWEDATFVLRTTSLSAAIEPQYGAKTFRLKALNMNGEESVNSISVAVPAPTISAPTVTALVIDNNVLLYWTAPSSGYIIEHYIITKDASPIGQTKGTFFTLFETNSGTYTYGVKAVDIAGNLGTEGTTDAIVDQPPDFELLTSIDYDESTGSFVMCYYEPTDGKIYGPVDLTETYETHFTEKSWSSPQDQVSAGYDIFIQENEGPATWTSDEEDLGSTLENVIVNFSFTNETVPGTSPPTVTVEMKGATSPGGGSWESGQSRFYAEVRYISVRITITPDGDDSMCALSNLQLRVDVKNVMDGNVRPCLAADSGGTTVLIPGDVSLGHGSKTFRDVSSITLAPIEDSDMAVTAIYDFTDVPNPTQFKILCFDNAGRRVDADVSWKIRGIEA